jgi:ubiquinone/menaquinone biosynthesis C-methylase UbiE
LPNDSATGKVLDIGAGRGISSYAFAKAGCQVTALEPDPSLLVGAGAIQALIDATQYPINIVQSYGETLPFDDNSFDIVYGRAVLHHARDINQFCQEAARVLKPGGIFITTREHVISQREDLETFFAAHPLHKLYGGENAFLLGEYISAIESANLNLTKTISPSASVINYAPVTIAQFRTQITRGRLARLLGPLLTFAPLYDRYLAYRDQKSNSAGRHYSFIGVKP